MVRLSSPGYFLLELIFAVLLERAISQLLEDAFSGSSLEQCLQGPIVDDGLTEWVEDSGSGSTVRVEWGLGNMTCNTNRGCFGISQSPDTPLEPQIHPLQIQLGTSVTFLASREIDVPFGIQPFVVDEIGFRLCDVTRGQPVTETFTSQDVLVPSVLLTEGNHYFIVNTTDILLRCKFGLRLNITVKASDCSSGENKGPVCSERGRCVTDHFHTGFQCKCCHGYGGSYCEHQDACATSPCLNGGTCSNKHETVEDNDTRALYSCACPLAYHSDRCEIRYENLCEANPCQNGATCEGDRDTFQCSCPEGYSGHHCEVNDDNCASRPCVNGVCVDEVGGHRCFCTPGFGGTNCEREYNECDSRPCQNRGFCLDKEDGYECLCTQGYTGTDCSVKVNLCDPNPCLNATECVDFGHSYECTCNPGFTGYHCEININECESSPCMNGGKCRDVISGFVCVCPEHVSGIYCEYERVDIPRRPLGASSSFLGMRHETLGINNLYIVAGTLAGALCIALTVLVGCYCRVHETYRHLIPKQRGYQRQREDSLRRKRETCTRQMAGQSLEARPSMGAILEASGEGPEDSNLDVPLVNSLRPKRV